MTKNIPYGAIQTQAEFQALMDGGQTEFWHVYGGFGSVEKVAVAGSIYSKPVGGRDAKWVEFRHSYQSGDYTTSASLSDMNIGQHYNRNFLFPDEDSANDFARFSREDPDEVASHKAYQQRCNDLFRGLDRWF